MTRKSNETMVRISITVPEKDRKAIEQLAEEQDRSINYICQAAIHEYIENRKK